MQDTIDLPAAQRRPLLYSWALVVLSGILLAVFASAGWDVVIYRSALRAVAAGHDPYAEAMAIQQVFHDHLALHPHATPPYSYVYSPITLPFLKLVARAPIWLTGCVYWLLYVLALLTQLWATLSMASARERRVLLYLVPVASFFPGLLANEIVMSGNMAYLLYASVLLAAVAGWRHNKWGWFYLAVLVASCVKAPLLSLVVIAVLSGRRQWAFAALTTVIGIALFAMQPLIWPVLFHHYLQAVELQFSFNRDFGCSPAGLFSGLLYDRGIPYSPAALIFYLGYAIPVFVSLLFLSRAFSKGRFSLQQWAPVMLVGVILLNPRIIEYDVAPLAIPLALIAWRFAASVLTPRRGGIALGVLFVLSNGFALSSWAHWKAMEGPLLVLVFLAGCWTLIKTEPAKLEAI